MCPVLLPPKNGKVSVTGAGGAASTALYSCLFGYRLEGNSQRVCQGGKWEELKSICQGEIYCSSCVTVVTVADPKVLKRPHPLLISLSDRKIALFRGNCWKKNPVMDPPLGWIRPCVTWRPAYVLQE